jgi:hypothetical protein
MAWYERSNHNLFLLEAVLMSLPAVAGLDHRRRDLDAGGVKPCQSASTWLHLSLFRDCDLIRLAFHAQIPLAPRLKRLALVQKVPPLLPELQVAVVRMRLGITASPGLEPGADK